MFKNIEAHSNSDLVDTSLQSAAKPKPLLSELPEWFNPLTCAIAMHPVHKETFICDGVDVHLDECISTREMVVFKKGFYPGIKPYAMGE